MNNINKNQNFSNHVVVVRRGNFYSVPVVFNGQFLSATQIESLYKKLIDFDNGRPANKASIGYLTACDRDHWADSRVKIVENGKNAKSLEILSAGIFLVW